MTPTTEPDHAISEVVDKLVELPAAAVNFQDQSRPRRASTTLISDSPSDIRRLLGEGETALKLISQCCGGGVLSAEDIGSRHFEARLPARRHS